MSNNVPLHVSSPHISPTRSAPGQGRNLPQTEPSHPELLRSCIRPLRPDDREPIHQILRETQVFTPDEISIALELIDIVGKNSNQRDYIIHVYEEKGSILGYYCIGPTPGTRGTFDLYWIAVKPSVHGKGIGGRLNDNAEALIRSTGGRLIVVETSSQPRYEKTRRFYGNHGYTELSRIRDYYRVGDDLVVFGKYLM